MNKLYTTIQSNLVDPELEAKVDVEVQIEPTFVDIPTNLYAAIETNLPELSTNLVTEVQPTNFGIAHTNRLYTIIIPEKPNILAEERIFVYVPKVTYNSPGIAKFEPAHFFVIDGKVSLRNVGTVGSGGAAPIFEDINSANDASVPDGSWAWIKVSY